MKNKPFFPHLLSVLAVCFFLFLAYGSDDDTSSNKNSDGTEKSARQIQIENQFSPWDGSHKNLEKLILRAMNDPDSYKHLETECWDMKTYLVVRTTYSGKNAYGGRVKAWVKVKVDLDGNILEVMDEGSGDPHLNQLP